MTQSSAIRLTEALTNICSKPPKACQLQVSRHAGVLSLSAGHGHSITIFGWFSIADTGRPTCSIS